MIPRPRVNLLISHGALALRGCCHAHAARRPSPARPRPPAAIPSLRPPHVAWAALLRPTCAIDGLACPECGGRLRRVAPITDRQVITRSPEGLSDWLD